MTDDDRRCTGCGKSVEDLPYLLWLFHNCRSCAAETHTRKWGDSIGTERKWRYFPRWHSEDAPTDPDDPACPSCGSPNTVLVREGDHEEVSPDTADHIGCFDCGEMQPLSSVAAPNK